LLVSEQYLYSIMHSATIKATYTFRRTVLRQVMRRRLQCVQIEGKLNEFSSVRLITRVIRIDELYLHTVKQNLYY